MIGMSWSPEPEFFIPFLIFSIPIIAISGGIISGIVKTLGRQRMIELAQRERIAAIERGIDPSKLPPLPALDDAEGGHDWMGRPDSARRRAQGLMVGGIITLFVGMGLIVFLLLLAPEQGQPVWAVGLIPAFVGVGLLLSAWLVKPRNGDSSPSGPPPVR